MRLLLVDDHALFREGLGAILKLTEPRLEVVGEAADARTAIESAQKTEPDLVLMDVVLKGTTGIAAARELRRGRFPGRILMLTAVTEVAFVVDAFAAGAHGYALKEQSVEELVVAMRRVSKGQRYLAPRLEPSVTERQASAVAGNPDVIETLSAREREIFDLVTAGYTNQRIASELFISVKTVETHRSRINRKLRVHSTAELIRLAALQGLVSA